LLPCSNGKYCFGCCKARKEQGFGSTFAPTMLLGVRRTIAWLRAHYHEPIRVGHLAKIAHMSVASFHRHFKAATAMSPIQYQKKVRLLEARKRLIARLLPHQFNGTVAFDVEPDQTHPRVGGRHPIECRFPAPRDDDVVAEAMKRLGQAPTDAGSAASDQYCVTRHIHQSLSLRK
jgi:AraC-like DNA-binding protein